MLRRKIPKKPWVSGSAAPVPVQMSQRVQVQEQQEKEKENRKSGLPQEDDSIFNNTQNHTQSASRFKSQRATLVRLTQQQIEKGKNPFECLLYNNDLDFTEIGCELIDSKRDPVSFIRSLRCFLTSQTDYKQRVQQYLSDFKDDFDIKNDDKLPKSEKYMRGIYMRDGDQKYQTQTSLIMCMLAIDIFKTDLTKILLQRLKEYVIDRKESANPVVIGLVLTQFKFTDQILDNELYNFMFEELFSILSETTPSECREMIVSHFRELSILKQEEAARRIYQLYENNKSELLKFVDVLCDMSIDGETSQRVFAVIQEYMENECSVEHYPAMIKYSQYYSQSADDLVGMFREHIKWKRCSGKVITEIFQLIDKLLKRDHMKLIDKWTSMIALVCNSEDVRILDFVILLKIADTNTETELKNVKKIVLDLVTKGVFTKRYLRESFKLFPMIIVENSQTLLELLDGLQKTRDSSMLYGFLATCYTLLFRISKDTKPIIGSLVNFLCEKRASLPFSSASEFKITILNIFNDVMWDKVTSAVSLLNNYKILLRVLDSSKIELTFNEHRLFMEFLCGLVYKVDYAAKFSGIELTCIRESIDALREHITMLVMKQTNNPEERIKQLGQISGVKIVSSIVTSFVDGDANVSDGVTVNVESIPSGPIRDAAELVSSMIKQCGSNQELLSVLLDEFSNEFQSTQKKRRLNNAFLKWLGEFTLNALESVILVPSESDHDEIGDWKLINKYEYRDEQFETPDHAINLGNIVLRQKLRTMVVIPSTFKLARLINTYHFGNIEHMGGLCSMPLVLPEHFGTPEDALNEDEEVAALQLDLYFHTCNWFRELISAFITTDDDDLKKIAKLRLRQLIEIEAHLNRLLLSAPKGYLPPFLDFSTNEDQQKAFNSEMKKVESSVAKPPKKARRKNNQAVVEEPLAEKPSVSVKSNQFCREMDRQIALLLKEKIVLKAKSDEGSNKFTIKELIYLLEDIHTKVTNAFNQRKLEAKGFTDELTFICDMNQEILPNIVLNFYRIVDEMNHLRDASMEVDGESEESQSEDEALMTKAFSIILEIFTIIFGSKKLKLEDNSELLSDMLKQLLKSKSTTHLRSDQDLICAAVIEQFVDVERNAQNLESAVNLIDFLVTVNAIRRDRVNSARISEMALRFCKTRWVDASRKLEQGSGVNAKLEGLLKITVKKATNQIQMKEFVMEMREITKLSDLASNKFFPCISRGNLICMLRIYVRRQSELINAAKGASMNFDFWSTCTEIEREFIETVKYIKSQAAFNLFLKNFIVYLKKFNAEGMGFLSELARTDRSKFVQLLKSVQYIRKMAHGVACELKHLKNNSIASTLPTVRQQFEMFYQASSGIAARASLPADCFKIGQLRNYGVDGVDIFSQNLESESANASLNTNTDEEEDDGDVDMDSDDNAKDESSAAVRQASFRSRSTIF